jgi:hypothetical protein
MSPQVNFASQEIYAPSRDKIDGLLEDAHPLDMFRHELTLKTKLFGFASDIAKIERAFVAAADLKREMNMKMLSHTHSEQALGYIADHQDSCDIPIVYDTGASFSVTPCSSDFVSDIRSCDTSEMTGLADSVPIRGKGWVEWNIRDVFGRIHKVRTEAFLVEKATVRLFSPQSYFQKNDAGSSYMDKDKLSFITAEGVELQFPYHPCSNLPLMFTDHLAVEAGFTADHFQMLAEMDDRQKDYFRQLCHNNHNLSKPQKELLLWHSRLSHAGFRWIQDLMHVQKSVEEGDESVPAVIPTKISGTAHCDRPLCAACQLSKAHRRTPDSQRVQNVPEHEMALRRDDLVPGQCVSVDQYVCKEPGRLQKGFGKGRAETNYNGGTIYVDHASTYISVQHQVSLRVGETLQGKHAFERHARNNGVRIQRYHGDNHPFASADFKEDLDLQNQTISYSGVGAHHQNGAAERALQTVTKWALAMMMHQLIHWPEQADPSLWPFAMDHAVHIYNNMPKARSGLTPAELFAGIKQPSNDAITRARVWGCPVYVLDPKLQDGKKLPKWRKRSRRGVYLGVSPDHSTTIGRVLNIQTGYISPQYHTVLDESFQTVHGELSDECFDRATWEDLISRHALEVADDRTDVEGNAIPFDDFFEDFNRSDPDPDPGPFLDLLPFPEGDETDSDSDSDGNSVNEGASDAQDDRRYQTRSGRRVSRPKRFAANYHGYTPKQSRPRHRPRHEYEQYLAGGNPRMKLRQKQLHQQYMASLDWSQAISDLRTGPGKRLLLQMCHDYDPYSGTQEDWNPLALAAKANDADADTFTFQEAMNHPNSDGFWEAAKKEIETLLHMDVWEEVDREPWMNVLPSTWAFRIKRFPNGLIRKFKARFCARGDKQIHGVDFFDTYAPVVQWTTVRLMLILSLELGLETKQVDYTAAFVHADVDKHPDFDSMTPEEQHKTGVYIECPQGFRKPGKVLKLKKALCGLRGSPRSFYKRITEALTNAGMEQQIDVDPCLFISDKVVCLLHVDDTLLYAKDKKDIDEVLRYLREVEHLTLEEESDVAGFLGVDIKRNHGVITMTQTGLIDRILEALHIEGDEFHPVSTPATDVLGKDIEGDPADCSFNYASVIGMMWYLCGHTRPDIGFAVSQAARFSFAPKRSHELALLRIGLYLKGTRTRGLIFKPQPVDQFSMEVYVDADFMGLHGKESRDDPTNVKSRTGFVILLNGCPIVWSSKLQESIALSTMMAEYYALSTAMREVIPLRALIQHVGRGVGVDDHILTSFKTTIWEDNNGALTLANLDPGQQTPRSKFYDCKVHWFRSHIKDKANHMTVIKVSTESQLADLYTKALGKDVFERLRKLLIGW